MGILEEVTSMKNQGMSEDEIIDSLQERGISPREINNALSQSQIKSAISEDYYAPSQDSPTPQFSQTPYSPKTMEANNYQPQQSYAPQQQYAPQDQFYPEENYSGYPAETTYTDNIIEVSEQVFAQKTKTIQKQIQELIEFKTISETHIKSMENRLKRIEATIDALQIKILEKIGSYGQNLNSIKNEMSMMQDSFGKVVNQAVKGATLSATKKIPKNK